MKTAFRTSIIILILFTFTGLSFASGDTVSREEFMKVINELKTQREQDSNTINKLSEEIETLKNTKKTTVDNSDIGVLKEDVEELSELMMEIEKKTLLDRVKVTGDLRTRMDWFDYKDDSTGHEEEVHALGSTRFRLLLKSDITENLKFTGRLAMHKNWNDSNYALGSSSFSRSRARTDEDLKVERAYVDYFFSLHEKLPMALTFGRLPNTDGLPTNLHEDTPRRSTFPGLAYDNEGDGVALSLNLDKLTGLPGSALRLLYLRTNVDNSGDDDTIGGTANDDIYLNNENHFKDAQSFIAQLETGFPGRLSGTTFMLNFLMLNPFTNVDPQQFEDAGLSSPTNLPNQLGDIWKLTAYIQSERFLGSNFDWFAGFAYMRTDAEKFSVYSIGTSPILTVGLNTEKKRKLSAQAFHVGMRYRIPWEIMNNAKIGIEYNRGSKYWQGFNGSSEDPLNKLNTNGNVWDVYYIQPINKHLMLRFGHTMVRNHYNNVPIFAPDRVDEKITNTYMLLDAKFY